MKRFVTAAVFLGLTMSALYGQTASQPALDLSQAETQALANQPGMLAAQLRARAFAERVKQARAAYMPTVNFNVTGAQVADANTAVAAGNLVTSAISGRFAYGGSLTQLVTDFAGPRPW